MLASRGCQAIFNAIRNLSRRQSEIARAERNFILHGPVEELGGGVLKHQAHLHRQLGHTVAQRTEPADGDITRDLGKERGPLVA
jgi:hypothetical protein